MATETKTFYPGAHEELSSNTSSGSLDAVVGKGSSNTGTPAYISASLSKTAYCYYPFDVSVIPDEADIESVSCVAKALIYNKSNGTTGLQLYSGTTAKGSSTGVTETNAKTYSLNTGTWTRAELRAIRLRMYAKSSSGSVTIRFYGADLTVTYTYQSEKFTLKLGGSWTDVARVFKKVNGIWVEQTDLANVIEDGVRYKNGGEIESTAPPVALISFTIDGTSYQAEEGMTWGEWVASSYNSGTWANMAGSVMNSNGEIVCLGSEYQYAEIKTTDTIISGYAYDITI